MSLLITLKTIIVYTFPVISLVGFITNIISFVIFSRKRFQNTIFSTYFRIYLVFEIMNLILPINKMFELNFGMYFYFISDFCCKLRRFFANCNYAMTPSFLVLISIDRYLSIAYPAKFPYRKKSLFQILISSVIITVNFGFYTPFWFYYLKETRKNETNQTSPVISYECITLLQWLEYFNIFQQYVLPFSLMFLFTISTIRTVYKSRGSSSNNSTITKSKDMKFAISSITFNILFLLFSSPYFILFVLKDYFDLFDDESHLYDLFYSISYFLFFFNSTISFYSNYISNSMFKKELKSLIGDKIKETVSNSKSKSTKNTSN